MTDAQQPPALTVIAGPSGVGKGTVVKALLERFPQARVSVSATTRDPRPGEVDGEHYHFLTPAEFTDAVEAGQFLEWAVVHGHHRYGTLRTVVEAISAAGQVPIVEIDLDGARQIRAAMPQALQIFIAPPSWEELEERLRGRGTETEEQIARRLDTARRELAAQGEFDVVVVNDEVERTVSQLASLMALT